jgi:hypothetical protein
MIAVRSLKLTRIYLAFFTQYQTTKKVHSATLLFSISIKIGQIL